jgi:hypothetical protein
MRVRKMLDRLAGRLFDAALGPLFSAYERMVVPPAEAAAGTAGSCAQPEAAEGTCARCRHANHGTMDAEDGFWACPWLGATEPAAPCRIRWADTGAAVHEPFDGSNGTWGRGEPRWRSVPRGYEGRAVVPADGSAPP